MKKLLIIIILLITISNITTKAYTAKKIDLRIKDNETTIVFLRLENSNSLLINDENDSNLFILDYKNDKNIKETTKIFNSKPDIFYLNNPVDKRIDNIHVFYQNNTLKFRINNYTLCIYENDNKTNCDFIYIKNLNQEFKLNENIEAIFYDENIDKKYLNNVQESWIESAIISKDSFTILKLDEDSYNIIIVPSTNQ